MSCALPTGYQNHGDPNLLCKTPSWTDIITFFGTNYLSHVVTLLPRPGQTVKEGLVDMANALFIPGSGALRVMRFLILHTSFQRQTTSLRKASKAGALCMVVTSMGIDQAMKGDRGPSWLSRHFRIEGEPEYIPLRRSFLGTCEIHRPIYKLIEVLPSVPLVMHDFVPDVASTYAVTSSKSSSSTPGKHTKSSSGTSKAHDPDINIPTNRDIARIIISILQVLWGVGTLYEARGNQIATYGYAAFGLTVTPYALMSLLNLVTSLFYPAYPTMFLVWTPDLQDALNQDHGRFSGIVARVDMDYLEDRRQTQHRRTRLTYRTWTNSRRGIAYLVCYVVILTIPFSVVAGLTGFRTGSDLTVQTSWILGWLIVGSVSALPVRFITMSLFQGRKQGKGILEQSNSVAADALIGWLVMLALWVPAIGGMVTVGKMLEDFGICTRLN